MKLNQLLKKSLIKNTAQIRGGGGWTRPDVPIPVAYHNRRELSIFDTNIWFYDDVAPEYFVSYTEMHMHDHFGVLKEWFIQSPYLLTMFGFITGFFMFAHNTTIQGCSLEDPQGVVIGDQERLKRQKKAYSKNFLGLNLTNANGTIHIDYDRKFLSQQRLADQVSLIETKKQINQEGKNFILKLEKEAREKVAKQSAHDDHAHHHH